MDANMETRIGSTPVERCLALVLRLEIGSDGPKVPTAVGLALVLHSFSDGGSEAESGRHRSAVTLDNHR
jgi:hypothetical protein